MKIRHKYFGPLLICLLLYVLAAALYLPSGYVVDGLFELLCNEFPSVFRSASFISEPEKHQRQLQIITAATVTLALAVMNYLSLLLDNKRMEHLAKETEGKYRLTEGLRLYCSHFFLADIISCAIPPLLLFLPVHFIPQSWLEYGLELPLMMELEVYTEFGLLHGALLLVAVGVITRFAVAPLILLRWRAAWLSGTAEVI